MTKATVLVASPSAIGSSPEASGSSVPACPARFAWNRRFTTLTAWVELMPTGLSRTTQPCTSRFTRLGSAARTASQRRALSTVIVRLVVEIALDRRRSQQLLDSFGFIEALVESKPDVGCKFQVDA